MTLAPQLASLLGSLSLCRQRPAHVVAVAPNPPHTPHVVRSVLSAVWQHVIYSLCFCNFAFDWLFSARYAFARRFCCCCCFFFSLVGLFFLFLLCFLPFTRRSDCSLSLSLSLSAGAELSRSRSLALAVFRALSVHTALAQQRLAVCLQVCFSSDVFVVVIAYTMALSGLGPGANFIQQFNSIIGSGYGHLFYTFFFLCISAILAGNMASIFGFSCSIVGFTCLSSNCNVSIEQRCHPIVGGPGTS